MKRAAVSGVLLLSVAVVVPLAGAAVALPACSMLATFDDRPPHESGGSGDGGSLGNDAGTNDQDASVAQGVYPNGCTGHAGPEPVKATGFCIDKTEVTNAQYAQFVDAKKGTNGQIASCAWNTTYVPESGWPFDSSKASFPVVEVDWCDAQAFCAWAGKRLCGKIGGGASAPEDAARGSDQWFLACSAAGTRAYPYAGSYGDDSCNGDDHNIRKAIAVATMPKCEGGFSGLFDMSGNVAEWEDACTGSSTSGGASDQCLLRGGAYDSSDSKLTCAAAATDARSAAHGNVGFRCCSSP